MQRPCDGLTRSGLVIAMGGAFLFQGWAFTSPQCSVCRTELSVVTMHTRGLSISRTVIKLAHWWWPAWLVFQLFYFNSVSESNRFLKPDLEIR